MLNESMKKIYDTMSAEERGVVNAIMYASELDEVGLIDRLIQSVNQRRARLFDFVYIDMSIDRSTVPLEITGAGTFLACIEATDNNVVATVCFETEDADTNRRAQFKRGKRIRAPFSRFYVYHAAQAGKTMKLMRGFDTKSLLVGFEDDSGESANSDLVTALGNSSVITTAQVAVDTTAGGILIAATNASRKRIIVKVPATAAVPVFIRGATGVTTANGHRLDPGDAIILNTTDEIYGIVSAGSVTVSTLEE